MSKRHGGEGTLFRRKDGRWVARTPHPERRAFYGRTATEARRKRDHYLATGAKPTISKAAAGQTWREYFPAWLRMASQRLAPNTVGGYEDLERLHIREHLGALPLRDIRPVHIVAVLSAACEAGLAASTVIRIKQVVSCALGAAVELDILATNSARHPAVKAPSLPNQPVVAYREEDARKLLRFIEGHEHEALVLLYLVCGARRGEALGLTWDDVDFAGGTVSVWRSLVMERGRVVLRETKTARSVRVLPLPPRVVAALARRRVRQLEDRMRLGADWTESELVFTSLTGTPLQPNWAYRLVRGIMSDAGVAPKSIHALRHTALSQLMTSLDPAEVQRIAGHARLTTTLNTYTHPVRSTLDRARKAMTDVSG